MPELTLPGLQGQRLREVAERREHDGDGGASDASDEEEIEEELGFISPLDNVNPYVTFKQALTGTLNPPCSPPPLRKVPPRMLNVMTWVSLWPMTFFSPALEANDHAIYQAATIALDVEQQALLMEIMRIADEAAATAVTGVVSAAGAPPGR